MLSMESNNTMDDIFNIGTGVPTSILDLVQIAKNTIGKKDIYPKYANARAGDILQSLSDMSKARNLLKFYTRIDLRDRLESFVRSYLSSSPIHV